MMGHCNGYLASTLENALKYRDQQPSCASTNHWVISKYQQYWLVNKSGNAPYRQSYIQGQTLFLLKKQVGDEPWFTPHSLPHFGADELRSLLSGNDQLA